MGGSRLVCPTHRDDKDGLEDHDQEGHDDQEDHDREDHYEEDEEAAVEEDVADQAGAGPEEPEGGRQEGRLRCEEEGHWSLRSGELESGAGGDLRREEDDPPEATKKLWAYIKAKKLN